MAGLMNTVSPFDSQEKSVAASVEQRTACLKSFSGAFLLTPARKTLVLGPCTSGLLLRGTWDARIFPAGEQAAITDAPAISFMSLLRSIGFSSKLYLPDSRMSIIMAYNWKGFINWLRSLYDNDS